MQLHERIAIGKPVYTVALFLGLVRLGILDGVVLQSWAPAVAFFPVIIPGLLGVRVRTGDSAAETGRSPRNMPCVDNDQPRERVRQAYILPLLSLPGSRVDQPAPPICCCRLWPPTCSPLIESHRLSESQRRSCNGHSMEIQSKNNRFYHINMWNNIWV